MKIWLLLLALCIRNATGNSLNGLDEQVEVVNIEANPPTPHLDIFWYDIGGNTHFGDSSIAHAKGSVLGANDPRTLYTLDTSHEYQVIDLDGRADNNPYHYDVIQEAPDGLSGAGDYTPAIQDDGAVDNIILSDTPFQEVGNADVHDLPVGHGVTVLNADNLVLSNPDTFMEHLPDIDIGNSPFGEILPDGDTIKNCCGISKFFGCGDGCCGKCCDVLACNDGCCDALDCNGYDMGTIVDGIGNVQL